MEDATRMVGWLKDTWDNREPNSQGFKYWDILPTVDDFFKDGRGR
jgi:hypothetical protein